MTASEWFIRAVKRLEESGDPDARMDARLFLSNALGCELYELGTRLRHALDERALARLEEMLKRREAGEPEQYIEGEAWFMGMRFLVDERALIPRADTEHLCEAALEEITNKTAPTVLDMCTGSGCLAVAIAKKRPDALVAASDISEAALALAAENARQAGVKITFVLSDGFNSIPNRQFDLIVCNPPYLSAQDMLELQREVACEPSLALYGGEDGLDFYRRFATEMKPCLKTDSATLYEIGYGQADEVEAVFRSACPRAQINRLKDYHGIERIIRVRNNA